MKTLLFIFLLENSRNDIPVLVFENTGKAGPGECHALIIYVTLVLALFRLRWHNPKTESTLIAFSNLFSKTPDSKRTQNESQNSLKTAPKLLP